MSSPRRRGSTAGLDSRLRGNDVGQGLSRGNDLPLEMNPIPSGASTREGLYEC
jgi:hypothetical protein